MHVSNQPEEAPALQEATRSRVRRGLAVIAFLVGLIAVLLVFGLNGTDVGAWRAFDEATGQWQVNPEFRSVCFEYCRLGSRAVRTRPFWLNGRHAIMSLRSIPFLPKRFAISPTSHAHYQSFDRGPLCAYLYLCGEQQVKQWTDILQSESRQLADGDERAPHRFLDWFSVDFPLCKDDGAIDSVRSLINDTGATRGFTIRENVSPLLLPPIAAIARDLHVPEDPTQMTSDAQAAVLARLDGYVRHHDVELWRTKQVNDFCAGVWAQVYSPPYQRLLGSLVTLHSVVTIACVLLVPLMLVRFWRQLRRPRPIDATTPSSLPLRP
jgi:hypothetical protein